MSEWRLTGKDEDIIYDRSVVTEDVYAKKFGRGTVYLIDGRSFQFTANYGANSEKSYTGCFFGDDSVKTVEQAMAKLDTKFKGY